MLLKAQKLDPKDIDARIKLARIYSEAQELPKAREVAADGARNTSYYLLWLSAAEKLVAERGLISGGRLSEVRAELTAAQAVPSAHDHDHHHHH